MEVRLFSLMGHGPTNCKDLMIIDDLSLGLWHTLLLVLVITGASILQVSGDIVSLFPFLIV